MQEVDAVLQGNYKNTFHPNSKTFLPTNCKGVETNSRAVGDDAVSRVWVTAVAVTAGYMPEVGEKVEGVGGHASVHAARTDKRNHRQDRQDGRSHSNTIKITTRAEKRRLQHRCIAGENRATLVKCSTRIPITASQPCGQTFIQQMSILLVLSVALQKAFNVEGFHVRSFQ